MFSARRPNREGGGGNQIAAGLSVVSFSRYHIYATVYRLCSKGVWEGIWGTQSEGRVS